MPDNTTDAAQQKITDELNVLADDIHVHDDSTIIFYVPTEQIDRAREVFNGDVEVFEEHKHEYLARLQI